MNPEISNPLFKPFVTASNQPQISYLIAHAVGLTRIGQRDPMNQSSSKHGSARLHSLS